MTQLKNIEAFSSLEKSDLIFLENLLEPKIFKKGDVLIKQGEIANNFIFLTSGIVSSVYKNKSKEFIRDFYFEPLIFTEMESFVKQVPAKFSVICVTDVTCQLLSHSDLEIAYSKIPTLRNVAYDLLVNGFINISNRLESLLTQNPEQRYLKLLNENPKLLHKIPLKMIASYMGVTDVALSRIRNRISQRKTRLIQ
tara:strand:- start:1633 stop:2220 length:588 start_codon:yes stop_codon:yes gene_type:complete